MDIRALQGNKLPERNNKVSDNSKADDSGKVRSGSESTSSASSTRLSGDKLEINAVSQDELNQALDAYRNLSKNTLSRLKDIKANIAGGVYTSEKMAYELAGAMVDKLELSSVGMSIEAPKVPFTTEKLEELRQRLSQDGAYLHKLSDKLLDAIAKL